MVSTCLILEMKNKKDITYKKQKVMKKKRKKKKSMKEYVKEFLEPYKVVKVRENINLDPSQGLIQKLSKRLWRKWSEKNLKISGRTIPDVFL